MVLPQQRAESTPRKDPEFRHVSGVRIDEIEVLNKDPNRTYRFVEDSADPRVIFCPEMYEEVGFRIERWPKFEGLQGEALERARASALRFRGRPFGLPGEKMMCRGQVLMSANTAMVQEMYAETQKRSDALADAIDPEKALARMRSERNPGAAKLALDLAGDKEMAGAERFDEVKERP